MELTKQSLDELLKRACLNVGEKGVVELPTGVAAEFARLVLELANANERKPLPPGAVIEFMGEQAVVVSDAGGSQLDVVVDGDCQRWDWSFGGACCTVVSLPLTNSYGNIEQLVNAAAIISAPLQMALEMGGVSLPGNGIEDLQRGLKLYQDWWRRQLAGAWSASPSSSQSNQEVL